MIGIGLRVYSNSKIFYTIIEKLESGDLNYLAVSQLNIPLALNKPESLNFVRNTLFDILEEYTVKNAVIRLAETVMSLTQIAIDSQLNCLIAVKKIPIKRFQGNLIQYFEEAKKLYLSRHHNIVPVNYGCKDDDFVYLAMPFFKNGSLKGLLDRRFLSSREIIRYSLQFLSGLNNVHVKTLIHFDIKTENILLSDSNQALLSDFGLAEYTCHYGFSNISGTTQAFAPPEFFTQASHNLKFDIYQAGLSMYRMCFGDFNLSEQFKKAHFSRGIENEDNFIRSLMKGDFPNRAFNLPHIPISLKRIITNCLKPDPSERYDTVIDILNDLSKIESANDWLFETDFSGNEKWIKEGYEVTARIIGNNWEVNSVKNNRRKRDYCGSGLSNADKFSLLYKCLNDLNW